MKNKFSTTMLIAVAIVVIGGVVNVYADPHVDLQKGINNIPKSSAPVQAIKPITPAISNNPILLPTTNPTVAPIATSKPRNITVSNCQTINWQPGKIYRLTGSLNMGTHITFPENAVDVIVGNSDLWNEEQKYNHVFIKPTTSDPEGTETNITFVGESNTSYEFIIKRVPEGNANTCVIVSKRGGMMNQAGWNTIGTREREVIGALVNKMRQTQKQTEEQQRNALEQYRGKIYTGYTWRNDAGWFGKNYVSDVYDDSRWTYIRLQDDDKGVMSIYGELDGKKNILQFAYDEATKIYKVSGIYQKLYLAYGNNKIEITRKS